MAFIWIGGPQLGIDIGSAALLLLLLGVAVSIVVCVLRRKHSVAVLASIGLVLGSLYFLYRTLVVPSGSWPVMYAAVNETTGVERRERIAALLPLWNFGQVRSVDWYLLSRKWGVCHRIWAQSECRMPSGQLAPEGFVRDDIQALAKE